MAKKSRRSPPIALVRKYRAQGETMVEIAERYGCTVEAIRKQLADFGEEVPQPPAIRWDDYSDVPQVSDAVKEAFAEESEVELPLSLQREADAVIAAAKKAIKQKHLRAKQGANYATQP